MRGVATDADEHPEEDPTDEQLAGDASWGSILIQIVLIVYVVISWLYAFDMVSRRNPVAFLGMVFVLEGTSINLATQAADAIRESLDLPEDAKSISFIGAGTQGNQSTTGTANVRLLKPPR